jgi:hypothetical protein
MKKLALIRGAEEAPTSWTLGMESGSGVVSTRTCWLNLGGIVSQLPPRVYRPGGTYLGCLAAILKGQWVVLSSSVVVRELLEDH